MFEDLKQRINRENLAIVKKKNRYLEEEPKHSDSEPDQDNWLNDKNKNNSTKLKPTIPISSILHPKDSPNDSEDSLSDYELQEREEVFNRLASPQQLGSHFSSQFQCSPIEKHKINFSHSYFTPENQIKQLQHSIQLSEEKLHLTEQYHQRELSSLTQKHDRKVQELTLEVQKLQLIIKQTENKESRVKDLTKENNCLKETLEKYEEKYWKVEDLEKQFSQFSAQNKLLKAQNIKLKEQIRLNESSPHQKQNQAGKINDSFSGSHQMAKQIQELEHKLKNSQRTVNNLERRVTEAQHEKELDRVMYEERIKVLERRVDDLEESLRGKQRAIDELESECNKIKHEKQAVEKSLMKTMESFSKHLSNESLQNEQLAMMTRCMGKSISDDSHQKRHERSHYKQSNTENEGTLNFEEMKESEEREGQRLENKERELSDISPVQVKKVSFYEGYLNEGSLNEERNERQRVLSYQMPGAKTGSKVRGGGLGRKMGGNESGFNPEKEHMDKVLRLERKLEAANEEIMRLLREKMLWKGKDQRGVQQDTNKLYF